MYTVEENTVLDPEAKSDSSKQIKSSRMVICPYFANHSIKRSRKIISPYFDNRSIKPSTETKSTKTNSFDQGLETKISSRLGNLFFEKPCIALAKTLLGKLLVRQLSSGEILKGVIVETESYLGVVDKASHTYNGRKTARNEAMYLNAGTAYVYAIYGIYFCFNISSLEEGSAVLVRALEPLEGVPTMKIYRSQMKKVGEIKTKDLCNGPSKLCQAFKIDKELNKDYLGSSHSLWLEEGMDVDFSNIICCKRIGIDSYGEEWGNKPLRFYIKNNCFISQKNKSAETAHERWFQQT